MIRFKNSSAGFTLIEAMIAITIMGMVLAPMFLLETNVFNGVARMAEKFERLVFAKQFFYSAQQQELPQATDYRVEKKEERPLSMVRYSLKPIDKQSSLAGVQRLYKQEVVANGLEAQSPQAQIVHFIYKPEPVPS